MFYLLPCLPLGSLYDFPGLPLRLPANGTLLNQVFCLSATVLNDPLCFLPGFLKNHLRLCLGTLANPFRFPVGFISFPNLIGQCGTNFLYTDNKVVLIDKNFSKNPELPVAKNIF